MNPVRPRCRLSSPACHVIVRCRPQNVVGCAGALLAVDLASAWAVIHRRAAGLAELLANLDAYSRTLAANMPQLFMQPFDAVHPNIGKTTTRLVCRPALKPDQPLRPRS